MMDGLIDREYDRDPDAIAWARRKVEHCLARYERFAEEGTDPAFRDLYRRIAIQVRRDLLGDGGCVVAAFDERYPALADAVEAGGPW